MARKSAIYEEKGYAGGNFLGEKVTFYITFIYAKARR